MWDKVFLFVHITIFLKEKHDLKMHVACSVGSSTDGSSSHQAALTQAVPMLRREHLQQGIGLNPISFPSADLTLKVARLLVTS